MTPTPPILPIPIESVRDLFEIPDGITYLNCASMAPQLRCVTEAGRLILGRLLARRVGATHQRPVFSLIKQDHGSPQFLIPTLSQRRRKDGPPSTRPVACLTEDSLPTGDPRLLCGRLPREWQSLYGFHRQEQPVIPQDNETVFPIEGLRLLVHRIH
jgi:hypothetical protein